MGLTRSTMRWAASLIVLGAIAAAPAAAEEHLVGSDSGEWSVYMTSDTVLWPTEMRVAYSGPGAGRANLWLRCDTGGVNIDITVPIPAGGSYTLPIADGASQCQLSADVTGPDDASGMSVDVYTVLGEPVLTRQQADEAANAALAQRYRHYSAGQARSVSCADPRSQSVRMCTVAWRVGQTSWTGRAAVSLSRPVGTYNQSTTSTRTRIRRQLLKAECGLVRGPVPLYELTTKGINCKAARATAKQWRAKVFRGACPNGRCQVRKLRCTGKQRNRYARAVTCKRGPQQVRWVAVAD